jgi:mycoredoxin
MMSAQVTLYGSATCGDCRRSKAYLDSRNVAYDYIDVEADESASELVIKINGGMRSIPLIVFSDGSHLTEPSEKDLEAKLEALAIL